MIEPEKLSKEGLVAALEYAITIIQAYDLECRNLPHLMAKGVCKDGVGFCGGALFRDAFQTIRSRLREGDVVRPLQLEYVMRCGMEPIDAYYTAEET